MKLLNKVKDNILLVGAMLVYISHFSYAKSCIQFYKIPVVELSDERERSFFLRDSRGEHMPINTIFDRVSNRGYLYTIKVNAVSGKSYKYINHPSVKKLLNFLGFFYDSANLSIQYPSPNSLTQRIKMLNDKMNQIISNDLNFLIPLRFQGVKEGEVPIEVYHSYVNKGVVLISMNETSMTGFKPTHIHDILEHVIGWILLPPQLVTFLGVRGTLYEKLIHTKFVQKYPLLIELLLEYQRYDSTAFEAATFAIKDILENSFSSENNKAILDAKIKNLIQVVFMKDARSSYEAAASRGVETGQFIEYKNYGNSISISHQSFLEKIARTVELKYADFNMQPDEVQTFIKEIEKLKQTSPNDLPINLNELEGVLIKRLEEFGKAIDSFLK
ncbi:MAG: hypothetical protein J0M15_06785 [Deltaproteobacteria bacterium]|nr:hypothetical protein [Deltaproteobacteria bacterium]